MPEGDWNVSDNDVYATLETMLGDGRTGVLATVVDVEGSAYRRPGAKMVVTDEGRGVGSITAGCLEGDVLSLARDIRTSGEAVVETYDLMGDDDVWGLGVGCNGVVDVLYEPVDDRWTPLLDALDGRDAIGVVTVLEGDAPVGAKAYVDPAGDGASIESDTEFPAWLTSAVVDRAVNLATAGNSTCVDVDHEMGSARVFVDGIAPPPELFVFGTGHDVSPVVELGRKAGFRVTVVGFRGATATEERFPDAHSVVSTSPRSLRETLSLSTDSYAVVMTHNFVDDRLALDELLATDVPYVGLLGPEKRFEDIADAFQDEGRVFDDDELERVYTPVGLDLGGGAPYQIAVSVVAEVLAVANDRTGGHLSRTEEPIHARPDLDA